MANVFGWPDFDENGEKILTTYENEYKDMNMDIRVCIRCVQRKCGNLVLKMRKWQYFFFRER